MSEIQLACLCIQLACLGYQIYCLVSVKRISASLRSVFKIVHIKMGWTNRRLNDLTEELNRCGREIKALQEASK